MIFIFIQHMNLVQKSVEDKKHQSTYQIETKHYDKTDRRNILTNEDM